MTALPRGESSAAPPTLRYTERLLWNAAVEHEHKDHLTILGRLARERAQRQRLAAALDALLVAIADDRQVAQAIDNAANALSFEAVTSS